MGCNYSLEVGKPSRALRTYFQRVFGLTGVLCPWKRPSPLQQLSRAGIWPVVVPVFFGTVELRPPDSLPSMPEPVKARLHEDEPPWSGFVFALLDCIDVSLHPPRCRENVALSPYAHQLIASGGETLSAAAELLFLRNPNPALATAGFATEIFERLRTELDGFLDDLSVRAYTSLSSLPHRSAQGRRPSIDRLASWSPDRGPLLTRPRVPPRLP